MGATFVMSRRNRSRSHSRDRPFEGRGVRTEDGPPDVSQMYSLKVDNLTYRITPEDLMEKCGKFGKVGDLYIPRDYHTQKSRGFAFVRFLEKRDAEDCIDQLDGSML